MPRIVFSPLVATRFLRDAVTPRPLPSCSERAGQLGLVTDLVNCQGENWGAAASHDCGTSSVASALLSERVARHIVDGPPEEGDLDGERFEALVDKLALLLSPESAEQGARSHPDAVLRVLHGMHEELDCEWLTASSEAQTGAWVLRARGAREAYPLLGLLRHALAARGVPVVWPAPPQGHEAGVLRASARLGRDFSGSRVRVGFVRGHLLELAFAVPGCFGHADEQALEAATIYAETALGEALLDEWVGSIGVAPAPRSGGLRVMDSAGQGAPVTPLAELASLVGRGIQGLLDGLSDSPLPISDASDWTLLDGQPVLDARGTPSLQAMDDVLMASTRCPELLKCFLEGSPVSSRRFGRVGERFVYLKLPSDLSLAERPAARARVEQVIEPALLGRGVVIGNAVGVAHLYIVMALLDLMPGLEVLLDCARAHSELFPPGSEVRFLDATWAEEWLALGW